LRERLAELGVPGSRVDLYGTSSGEAVISEYAGEARLVQEPETGEIGRHDVIFLCEPSDLSRSLARAASPDAVVIDLVNSLTEAARPPRVHMDVNPEVARNQRVLAVAHPLANLLSGLLAPLEAEAGLSEAVAVVLRPASDFGKAGVEELREQTVRLLNFTELPSETFGRQLAFNVIPQARLACDPPGLEATIEGDVAELLGWGQSRLTLRLLAVPVFYGHCVQLRLRFREALAVERIEQLLASSTAASPQASESRATPLEISGDCATSLYQVSEDGLGGVWLLAVAGESDGLGADQAVRLADAACGLRAGAKRS
jgi:aspartate-semialdehyde dehydrogenase